MAAPPPIVPHLAGRPLYASKGARIQEHYTSIRSFAVRSIPIGGDSAVSWNGSRIMIGPHRSGPAACLAVRRPPPPMRSIFWQEEIWENWSFPPSAGANRPKSRTAGQRAGPIHCGADGGQPGGKHPGYVQILGTGTGLQNYEIVHKRRVKLDRAVGIGAPPGLYHSWPKECNASLSSTPFPR